MELLQLHYFLEVARLEHVTEAAKSLNVTQSSLSKTIQRLEEDLGVPLFDRTGRKLRLNAFGNRFLRRAERALFELEQGKQELRDLSEPEHGTLELAVTTASTLPSILSAYRKKRPHVQFHVQMLSAQKMIALLQRGEADYCLSSPPFAADGIACQTVFIDPILVAVPRGHRLATRSNIALAELEHELFVGVKKGYGVRDLVDGLCQASGFKPIYAYEGDEPARLSDLVEAGIGIAFIPGTARRSTEGIHYLEVDEGALKREIALLWNENRYISQAAKEFREVVVEYFEALTNPRIPDTPNRA